ncbi:cytochrome P450 [Streptomyces sp. NPDC048182]|uniref:cytochrome P450 n=1 Tax=Streptomyces sp. NPDC048182 TaxID=3365507 RepID=UPI00371C0AF4
MTRERALPPVRDWPAADLPGTDFDPVLAALMREGPPQRVSLPDGEGWAWLVTRYEEVRRVTNDARFGRAAVADRQVTRLARHFVPARGAVGFLDPPEHTRLRRVMAPALSARGVERVRERARAAAGALVDGMLAQGPPADLTEAVLGPFPAAVATEVMGVPAADHDRVRAWTRLLLSRAHDGETSERARRELTDYLGDLIGLRSDSAGEDLASLLGAAVGRDEIGLEEAVGLAVLLQIGGAAVTDNTGQLCFLLLSRPELAERLRSEPGLRPRAVEELLRWIPHRNAVGLSRIALADVSIGGVEIRAGEAVYVSYLAANRDPSVFPAPDTIDFTRDPRPHLSFGSGPHHCPGGTLSRLETAVLLDTLLDRVPGLKLAVPPEQVPFKRGTLIRGPEALPVTW